MKSLTLGRIEKLAFFHGLTMTRIVSASKTEYSFFSNSTGKVVVGELTKLQASIWLMGFDAGASLYGRNSKQ